MSPPAENAWPDAGEHDRSRLALQLEHGEQLGQFAVQGRVDGVHRRSRVIDHHVQHVAVTLDPDRLHQPHTTLCFIAPTQTASTVPNSTFASRFLRAATRKICDTNVE